MIYRGEKLGQCATSGTPCINQIDVNFTAKQQIEKVQDMMKNNYIPVP